jgi:hypothetical protein
MRISLPACLRGLVLTLLPILAGGLFVLALPAGAHAAESCANEPYRLASDSTQLPDCRAYELVSPANAGGAVEEFYLGLGGVQAYWQGSTSGPRLSANGNLITQLNGALEVKAGGSAVFWDSYATPPDTGAMEDAHAIDPFRSVRTASGWSTKDLFPSDVIRQQVPGGLGKVVFGASEDGSTALVASQVSLFPQAFENPLQAQRGSWEGVNIYRVNANSSAPPQLVTHGESLLPENKSLAGAPGPFEAVSASPDLSEVAFKSDLPLESNDICNTEPGRGSFPEATASMYLWNANSITGLAHVIFSFEGNPCTAPNVDEVPTILPDGRPILTPNPAGNPSIPGRGPLVENYSASGSNALVPLAGSSGGTLLSVAPDGSAAFVLSEGNIYSVSTTTGWGGTDTVCISCASDQTDLAYITTSKDGSHLLFTTDQGLWEWSSAAGAQLLTSARDIEADDVVLSENGQYVVLLTSEALRPCESPTGLPCEDTNGGPDLYELSVGRPARLITSGTSADQYALYDSESEEFALSAGVSDDGERVVYNSNPAASGSHMVIEEWDAGQTVQLSPLNSESNYHVQAVAGSELQDVFFIAHDSLVPWDLNGGQADIYDANLDGGFPSCTPGDPQPPPGAYGCGAEAEDPDPTVPPPPAYTADLTPPSDQIASLPPDTSQPAGTHLAKTSTRAQQLATALKACKRKSKKKRAACEAQARKKYGAKTSSRSKKGRR